MDGLLGGALSALGVTLGLTQAAVVIAVAFVSSPLYVRQAIATFEAVDPDLVAASGPPGARPGSWWHSRRSSAPASRPSST